MPAIRPWLAAALTAACALPLSAQQTQSFRFSGPATVYDLVGQVTVVPATGPTTVTVHRVGPDAGQLQVRQDGDRLQVVFPGSRVVYDSMGYNSRTDVHIADDGSFGRGRRVVVAGSGDGLHAWADLEVAVAPDAKVEIGLAVGRVTVRNVAGQLRIKTANADIDTHGGSGALDLGTGSGDITITEVHGAVNASTGSGDITVDRATTSDLVLNTGSGDIRASSVTSPAAHLEAGSGDVTARDANVQRLTLQTGSGDIEAALDGNVSQLMANAGSGDVTIAAPASLGAAVRITTGSGDLHTDFPVTVTHRQEHQLVGTIGDGHGQVQIETGSGDVHLTSRRTAGR
jgi:hypothetical protein